MRSCAGSDRWDGKPLGTLAQVREAMSAAFPGITFHREPSGVEKRRAAAAEGIVFPDAIRQHLESAPAQEAADYQGPQFSAQFYFGPHEIVQQVDAVLYGTTTASEEMFQHLEERFGWVTTHP